MDQASKAYREAASIFSSHGEIHRSLRALINSEICTLDFDSFLKGVLFGLEQEVRRQNHSDLVGNIQKARCVELIERGKSKDALTEARLAVQSYSLDGHCG